MKCVMASDVEDVVQLLMEKKDQYQAIDKQVVKCYNQIIKMVEIEKLEYMKRRGDSGTRLMGDEGRLFKLLKEGPSREMKPAMIYRVMKRLTAQSNEDTEKLKSEIIQVGKRVVQAVEKSIQELRGLWGTANEAKEQKAVDVVSEVKKPEESADFRFSSEMCHKHIQVLSSGKRIKRTVQNYKDVFALVSPAVSARNTSRIRVRVVRSEGYVCLGLADKQQMVQGGYTWPQNQGVYLIGGGNGNIFNVLDPEEHGKQSSFRFSSGDVVEMEYNPSTGTLKYENKNDDTCHTLKNIREQEENPLHFCVYMIYKDEQVEVV